MTAPLKFDPPSGVRLVRGAKTLSEFVAERAKPHRLSAEAKLAAARADMKRMAESGEWDGAGGLHLVVLYEFLHREVYGVEALELDAKTRRMATSAAKSLTEKFFGGDYGATVSFMRWAWQREQGREEWRRANGREGGRLGWPLQFSARLVSDYRLDGERKAGAR